MPGNGTDTNGIQPGIVEALYPARIAAIGVDVASVIARLMVAMLTTPFF